MLHVILFILKLIGCLILGIIVLLAIVLAAILLSPFRYQVKGRCDKELKNLDVHGTFSYLFHLIAGKINYEKEELTWEVRVAWIRKSNTAEFMDDKKQGESEVDVQLPEEDKVMTATEAMDTPKEESSVAISEKETKKKETEEKETERKRTEEKTPKKDNDERKSTKETLPRKLMCTIRKVYDKIKSLIRKKDILMAFITDETHMSAFSKFICEIKKWLKKWCPRDVQGNVQFGFEEPDLTGKMLAVLGMIYPFIGEHVSIRPDFETPVLDGDLSVKGKLRLSSIAKMAWNLVWTKNVRTTIRDIMKFSFDEGGTENG